MSRIFKRGSAAQVFASTCTGLESLSREIGRPLVHIDAAFEPERAVAELSARDHAGARRWADSFQPLMCERGWSDWRLQKLKPPPGGVATRPFGVEAEFGVLYVPLPGSVTLPAFRAQLRGALRHLLLQAVTIQPSFLEQRSDDLRAVVVEPRYTPAFPQAFRGATLVEDLYVMDVVAAFHSLFWWVVAARAAAGEGSQAHWR